VRATASMPAFERALADLGLPALASAGRGFWSRQEVVDLTSYLAALANPLHERALVGVLASPLAGVSADALALATAAARGAGRGPWPTSTSSCAWPASSRRRRAATCARSSTTPPRWRPRSAASPRRRSTTPTPTPCA